MPPNIVFCPPPPPPHSVYTLSHNQLINKHIYSLFVDEHAKLKPILKSKQSSQPRATSPTWIDGKMSDEKIPRVFIIIQ